MNVFFEKSHQKKKSYLYYGLITAALAGAMLVWGILSAVRGDGFWLAAVSFISAAVWGVTAGLSLYVYYDANRTVLKSDDGENEEL